MNIRNNSLNNPVWTAIVTPLTNSGLPDLDSMERLLREQEEAGNGVLILGSTGESLNLSDSERKLIVEFTLSLDLNVPIMVGVGGHFLPDMVSWLYFLETKKVDAYLMVTPLYSKPGPEGQYRWFKTLMDIVTRPVMLYNIPGRTGTPLNLEVVRRLSDHRNFWAIKEASGSVDDFCAYGEASGDAMMFSGDDLMLPQFAPHGARGVVSVAGNVWPRETRLYTELALEGSLSEEDKEFWMIASKAMFVASNPVPAKMVLYKEGRIRTPEVKLPLHKDDMTRLEEVCDISRKVNEWYQKKTFIETSVG
ncbi:4-hydroxy-tetrahydrodipicolinate synthase [Balneolaceae bacterium ANBcel3]|nr:4-hydroxy-tetrahydrodipicolinate synthase [Balneolaceae bacterium ANBcel3]